MAEDNISNIINNFKHILNNNSNNSNSSNNNENSSNINITPEMIGNLTHLLQCNSENNSSANSNSSDNSENDSKNSDSDTNNNIDFETILKIKSIMETLNNNNDPRSKLLYSLKPYLRESKQKKLDQYVNLLKITQISGLFKTEKGAGS